MKKTPKRNERCLVAGIILMSVITAGMLLFWPDHIEASYDECTCCDYCACPNEDFCKYTFQVAPCICLAGGNECQGCPLYCLISGALPPCENQTIPCEGAQSTYNHCPAGGSGHARFAECNNCDEMCVLGRADCMGKPLATSKCICEAASAGSMCPCGYTCPTETEEFQPCQGNMDPVVPRINVARILANPSVVIVVSVIEYAHVTYQAWVMTKGARKVVVIQIVAKRILCRIDHYCNKGDFQK